MKLQNLTIIFIIIIIPIVLIFSLYLNLETKTITMQTNYDEKLIEATKEAVEAFEINTTEWNSGYDTLANVKRQDLMSSIEVFTSSLANKMGIGGSSQETILSYVPAIVYIMYDGYYIYSPTYVPQTITDDKGVQLFYYKDSGSDGSKITSSATQNIGGTIYSGEPMYSFDDTVVGAVKTGTYDNKDFTTNIEHAQKTYKHVLKTFVPYTTTYGDYVINYTLDNYIRVYSTKDGNVAREGYLIEDFNDKFKISASSISGITYNEIDIKPEVLTENIAIRNDKTEEIQVENYTYIYNSSNEKRYFETKGENAGKFFSIDKYYVKNYNLPDEYKKILIIQNTGDTEYLELYQKLNGEDNNWYYKIGEKDYKIYENINNINITGLNKNMDCSAINYYVENYCFTNWLLKSGFADDQITDIKNGKNKAIISNINNNLNLSISNYSANSKIDYKLPEISDEDWEQALSNISMITFFQGKKIGLKTYNNYVVVTSTENNEYVSEDSLYYIGSQDLYYHRLYCSSSGQLYSAYKDTEFKVQSYQNGDDIRYYYKHTKVDGINTTYNQLECFDCIVNRNNYTEISGAGIDNYNSIFYNAIARERYIQMQKTRLTNSNGVIPETPVETTPEEFKVTIKQQIVDDDTIEVTFTIQGGSKPYTVEWEYNAYNGKSNEIYEDTYQIIQGRYESREYRVKDSNGEERGPFNPGQTDGS